MSAVTQISSSATSDLQRLTNYVELAGHNRQHLNRMMYWKLKAFWPQFFGPKPGDPHCQVAAATQALFEEPERGGTG